MKRSRAGLVALKINSPSLCLIKTVSPHPRGGGARMARLGIVLTVCLGLFGCSGGSPTPPPPEPEPPAPAPGGEAAAPALAPVDPASPAPGTAAGTPAAMPGEMPPGGGPTEMPPGQPMPGGPGVEPGMGPGMSLETGMPGAYGQQQKQRPQDFSEWKESDYLDAKKENDHRLSEAATYIAQSKKNDEGAALLRKLLTKTEKPKEEKAPATRPQGYEGAMGPGMGAPYGGQYGLNQQVIQALVRALGVIETPSAKKTLMEIFTGKFDTDDNATARLAAFKELAVEPTPELEKAMFLAVTQPEKLWPDFKKKSDGKSPGTGAPGMGMGMEISPGGGYGAGGYGNDQLMQAIVQAVDASASEEFRTKLAEFLLGPNASEAKIQQLRTILQKPVPENIGAQLKLYAAQEVDTPTKEKLEKYFLEYSSEALARILGVVAPPAPASTAPEKKKSRWSTGTSGEGAPGGMGIGPMEGGMGMGPGTPGSTAASFENDPELPFKVAKYLWDPKLAMAMGLVLNSAAPPPRAAGGGGAAVAPGMGMEGGMGGGGAYGGNDRFANVVMIAATIPTDSARKLLADILERSWEAGPQKLEQAGLTNKVVWDPAFLITIKSLPWAKTASKPRGGRNNGAVQPNNGPEQAWQTTGQKMMKHLCNNLATASLNSDQPATAEGFPVKLHKDANVTARLDLEWPKDAPKELAGAPVDPLRIHFVRIEETLPVVKALTHYRRQGKGAKERNTTEYVWFDRISKSETPGVTKSLDIMITQQGAGGAGGEGYVAPGAQPGAGSRPGQNEMALVIDVLVMETGKATPAATPPAEEKTEKK